MDTTAGQSCSGCGAPLTGRAEGLCPRCLLGEALRTPLDDGGAAANLPRDLGEYELIEEISRGGTGVVYKARQKRLDRLVALKMLRFLVHSDPEAIKRFRVEATVAASLHHPNIVAIHEVGVYDDEPFIVMDLIEGPNLAQFVKGEALLPKRAASCLRTVAEAIHYAHERGILHRDLKPSNVLIDGTGQPRITDFGLAKRLSTDSSLTLTGQIIGSPGYMPPEQASGGRGRTGRASDVYALGATLYHLLTGRPPFAGESLDDTLRQIFTREPVAPKLLNPAVPPDLETICLKCLEKEPGRRYPTARELADELGRFLRDEPTLARPVGAPGRLWRWARRKPALASLTALLGAALAAGTAGVVWQWRRAEDHARQLRRNLYASDMKLAQQALASDNPSRTRDLLSRHVPREGEEDLRGWEWRYLWSQCRNDALFTVCQRPRPVASLSVSHDGKWLALGDETGGEVAVWDWEHRREQAVLQAGTGAALTAFSPVEPLLAVANGRSMTGYFEANLRSVVQFWHPAAGEPPGRFPVHGACRRQILFTPDGEQIVTSENVPGRGNAIHFWRARDGAEAGRFAVTRGEGQHGPVWPAALSADGRVLAAGTPGPFLQVVETGSWEELWRTPTPDDVVTLAISPDGRMVAGSCGLGSSTIQLWDAKTGAELAHLEGHHGWVSALVFWPDGKRLASASGDRTIRVWDWEHLPGIVSGRALAGHASEVWGLALLPDQRTLVSAGKDGAVLAWDAASAADHSSPMAVSNVMAFSWAGERTLLVLTAPGEISRASGPRLAEREVIMNIGPVWAGVFSRNGRWLAASGDSSVRVFDLDQKVLVRERELRDPASDDRAFCPIRFAGNDSQVISTLVSTDYHDLWDFVRNQPVASWRAERSEDVLLPGQRGQIEFWQDGQTWHRDLATGKARALPMSAPLATGAALSPDGRVIAVSSWTGGVRLWDARTGRPAGEVDGFQQSSHAVGFSPDGRRLAAGGNGGEAIKIWAVDGLQELLTIAAGASVFYQTAFSPDGGCLAAISQDRVLRIWRAPSHEEMARSSAD